MTQNLGEAMAAVLVPWEARARAAARPGRPVAVTARQEIRASQWRRSLRAGHRLSRQAGERKKRK